MKTLIILLIFTGSLLYSSNGKAQCDFLEINEKTKELVDSLRANEKKYGLTDEDSVQVVQKLSTYREYFKQWENSDYTGTTINDAIPAWRWTFNNGPLASQYTYINGIKIMEYLYEKTPDEELKERYLDTLFLIYDQRVLAFGDEPQYGKGFILGQKGGDILKYRSKCYPEAYSCFVVSIKEQGVDSYSSVAYYYYYVSTVMVKAGKADSAIVFDNYETASYIIGENIKQLKDGGSAKKVKQWNDIQDRVDNLFAPWASCEDINRIYAPKFEENPEDINLLKSITKIMAMAKCTDEDLYFNASDELYKLEPSVESAINLGKMYYSRKMFNKAIEYYNLAIDSLQGMDKADLYLDMGRAYYGARNYSTTRSMANKCLEIDPSRAEAYILIGDMYYYSSCGEDDVQKRFVYMAAQDKYNKAKSVATDERILKQAADKAASCYSQFPNSEDVFFFGYSKGQSITVGCWINETTTLRTVD
jgi:tetratricopeptide (TPR) repeat protein